MLRFILPILLLFVISGCQSIDVRGQYIDDKQISTIEDKKLNKDQVIELLGSPTLVPEYTPNRWYYAERAMQKRAWFLPKVVAQRVVVVTFGVDNIVKEVEVFNDSHSNNVKVVSEYTKSLGDEENALQQFVRNIGRFNKNKSAQKKRHGAS